MATGFYGDCLHPFLMHCSVGRDVKCERNLIHICYLTELKICIFPQVYHIGVNLENLLLIGSWHLLSKFGSRPQTQSISLHEQETPVGCLLSFITALHHLSGNLLPWSMIIFVDTDNPLILWDWTQCFNTFSKFGQVADFPRAALFILGS